ncbi:GIN domain-containing protein [Flavobacterium sp.]|uniref:GIN domain-containing protein n=1 Tax=Flavobacterium sp. TaxID=239 RepID=UPI003752AEF2
MKNYSVLLMFLFVSTFALAQKNEKIKGSKIVTIEQKEIGSFDSLEVGGNIEVYLDRGEKSELKIEADDNLHDIINIDLSSNTLRINTSKKAVNFKKLIVRVTYTNELKMVTSKNSAIINAIQEIQLNEITLKAFDDSKLNLNVNSNDFILQTDNDSKTELNLKSEKATIELSKNSTLKALITSINLKCDMYQKSKANLEGDITNAVIRLDNNAEFSGNNLVIKTAELIAEGYSHCSINVNTNLSVEASGNSDIKIYGEQKVEIKRFMDNANLNKKPTK